MPFSEFSGGTLASWTALPRPFGSFLARPGQHGWIGGQVSGPPTLVSSLIHLGSKHGDCGKKACIIACPNTSQPLALGMPGKG